MDDLQHRLLVSQWIAEEFAGIIDEDRRAKLEAWRKESAGNEQEYQELLQEFRSGDILEPYPEEEIGRHGKNSVNETGLFILFLDTGIVMWL